MQEIFSPDQNYVVIATKIINYLDLSSLFTCRSVSKVGILCLNFPSILSDFLSREKLTQKWLEPEAEQFAKIQLLNNKIDQNTNFAKLPSTKWLFLKLYNFKSYLQQLRIWLQLLLCQFLSW
jgi:hypothetical protein